MSTKKKKKSPWVTLIVLLVVFVMIVGGLSLLIKRDPVPKNDPALRVPVVSKRKQPPVSTSWDKFMRGESKLKSAPVQALADQLKDKKSKQPMWFRDLAKAQAALAKLAPHQKAFLALLKDKGCPPLTSLKDPKEKSKQISHLGLMRSTKLASIASVAMAQAGKLDAAAAQMRQLMDGLAGLSARCPSNNIGAMIHIANVQIIASYSLFLFRHPKLSAAAKTSLLKGLHGLVAHNMMPDAMRGELKYQQEAIDLMVDGVDQSARMNVGLKVWPWWDAALTKEWIGRYMQVEIYRAMQPYGPVMWKIYPIQRFFNDLYKTDRWKLWFQYNAIGLILMGVAVPTLGKFVAKFHQGRCMVAATHAAALSMWRKHKLPMPSEQSLHKVVNPLTKKSFPSPLPSDVCTIRKPGDKEPWLKASTLRTFIPAPPGISADAPASPSAPATPRQKTPPKK